MTFAEKLKTNRLSLNLSQTELAEKTGISERTIYSYEILGIMPRSGNIKKIAAALNVSYNYLLSDDEDDPKIPSEKEIFIDSVKERFGQKSMAEARELLTRSAALFAGGEIDEEAKDVFFRSLMEVYLESKAEAEAKFSPRRRKARTKPRLDV
ncbi:MAG: helix-turn-helix domain-containing protein [Ruminococcus sp.]|jgi:transcriptional regulator with XRE-family HTH domain|nr:helix-turn-helix domain-containing protein [Ruminococcus sp.]